MMSRIPPILIFALVLQAAVSAQQAPITSQYLTNGLVINPSYAGTRGALSANLSYRKQWAQIIGAPQFQNISLHSPINQKENRGKMPETRNSRFIRSRNMKPQNRSR